MLPDTHTRRPAWRSTHHSRHEHDHTQHKSTGPSILVVFQHSTHSFAPMVGFACLTKFKLMLPPSHPGASRQH
jgi:hypothetical protein